MAAPEPLHDHWWWRPGWAPGRSMLTFHLTFADSAEVCSCAEAYQAAVAPFDVLAAVPDTWLHLTVQDVGFLDEVTTRQIDDVTDAAHDGLATLAAFDIEVHPAHVGTEGIFLPVADSPPLESVRTHLRRAIADAGLAVPGEADGFWPHISVAYANGSAAADPIMTAVASVTRSPLAVRVSRVDLLALRRDDHLYEWLPVAAIPLSGEPQR